MNVTNTAPVGVSVDANTSIEGLGKQTTQAFSTTQPDVLVAFATSDGRSARRRR